MKKKLIAFALALSMAFTSVVCTSMPVFARSTTTDIPVDSGYNYRNTTGLEADYVNGNIILTWPSVAKDGTLLNQNPLASSSYKAAAPGDPMGSWTMPYQGLLIKYNGWSSEYSPSKKSVSLTGNEEVMMGIVAGEAEGCQTVLDYGYDDNAKLYLTGNKSHIDETVVATGYAKSYRIEYSDDDGATWKTADTTSTFNTQKKIALPVQEGVAPKTDVNGAEYIQDNKNTVFLVTQHVETFPSTVELEEGKTYKIRVVPLDAVDAEISVSDAFSTSVKAESSNAIKVPAFPGVEGGGTYTTGGRSTLTTQGEVYVVTSLDDSVTDPKPGTFRYGITHRQSENVPLTVVFAVGGTIHIDPAALKSQRRFTIGSNTTILGQTAPGEGITFAGGSCNLSGTNIIMRYVRFRVGEGYDIDGGAISGKNIVVDHCTFNWGVDETFSAKELLNSTISYNIIANGLALVNKNGDLNTDAEVLSGESEFKHGMGSLLNGYDSTIVHNIWAHNGTRNPRFEGGFTYNNKFYDNKMDFANNVIYNWGHNSGYGGERGNGQVNFEGNYYKPGPNTLEKCYTRMFDFDSSSYKSSYYVNGNYITSSQEASDNNMLGLYDTNDANFLTSRVELTNPYTATSAQQAYIDVLAGAGASRARDAVDERLMEQIKNGTGRFINSEGEAGGYYDREFVGAADSDKDGIPDKYEVLIGTDANVADSTVLITDEANTFYGYTPIEVYANDILGEWGNKSANSAAALETVSNQSERTVSSSDLAITHINEDGQNVMGVANTDLIVGKTYTITTSKAVSGKVQVLFNDVVAAECDGSSITVTPTEDLKGSYLMQLRYLGSDNNSAISISDQVGISVIESKENMPEFTAVNIGDAKQGGTVSYNAESGTLYMGGTGLLGQPPASGGNGDDACFFNYVQQTGNFDIKARINTLAKIDYSQKAGIMVRSSLDPKSEFYMDAVSYIKGEDYENAKNAEGASILAKIVSPFARSTDGGVVSPISPSSSISIPQVRMSETPNQAWGRIVREGQTITIYASHNGSDWVKQRTYENTTLPQTVYLGFALDAAQDKTEIVKYNKVEISDISIEANSAPDVKYGDADTDNTVSASDSSEILQKALDTSYKMPIENVTDNYLAVVDVDCDGEISAADAAVVLQKAIDAAFKMPVEQK